MTEPITPRISFGIIVLNGEPFLRYCLRSLYPYAHQIIVVEGGSKNAAHACTPDGHSVDGTLEVLRDFKQNEDPDDKLEIVTREGFWEEKNQQSQAYAQRATGDYLWQVDSDEFYKPADMETILELLRETKPAITAFTFKPIHFWGGLEYSVDGPRIVAGGQYFHRGFRWGEGYTYIEHRPPTVLDAAGQDTRKQQWLTAAALAARGIYLYHYTLIFPLQVKQKSAYYEALSGGSRKDVRWAKTCYHTLGHPYHIHNISAHPSWLEKFTGSHPPQIMRMMEDIRAGKLTVELRQTEDIDALLAKWWYPFGREFLRFISPVYGVALRLWWRRPFWMTRGYWRGKLS